MFISVVIPTHVRATLLRDAITSVLGQVRLPDEILVVDDVGDPATRQCVLDIAAGAVVPIRYLANTACPGVCGSRNFGAYCAYGDWIAFLDDDDVWHPTFLDQLARQAELSGSSDAGVTLVLSGLTRQEVGQLDTIRSTASGITAETVLQHRSSMTGSNALIRADMFCAVRGFDPAITVMNDWDLFVRLIRRGTRYAVVPEPLVEWRDHGGARIATPSLKRADGIDRFLARYGAELPKAMRRELRTTAIGIRRRQPGPAWRYAGLSVALALAHGPAAALARLLPRRVRA